FFAHIRSAPGLAVTSAAAGVVDFGYGIDPYDGITWAARLGLGFARVLAFLRRRRDGCRRCGRHAPALGHEYAFGLAARLNGRSCWRSSHRCIAWLSSAPRSRIATKPAVLPMPHT